MYGEKLEQLSKKYSEVMKEIELENKAQEEEISNHNYWIRNKYEKKERLLSTIRYLKEEIYKAKLEEEKWQQKSDVLKSALKD